MTTIYGSPTGNAEVIVVDETAKGITADLCGTGNLGTALIQCVVGAIRYTLHSATATPTSCDLYLACTSIIAVTPAAKFRCVSDSTTPAAIKVQAFE